MIPDKIYISHLCDTTIGGEEGHLMAMSFEDNGGEEYIRKDALMEWVKEHKCAIETHGDERDAYLRGEYSMLNSLIDKLNSM